MKKKATFTCIYCLGLGLLLVFGVFGAAMVGASNPSEISPANLVLEETSRSSSDVGLITDGSGLWGLNWMANYGMSQAEIDLGVVGTLYTPTNESEYVAKIQECVDDGNELCITVGFLMAEATTNMATANPGTYFLIVDYHWESYPDNVQGMIFAANEVAYLAGTLAGLMTESNILGAIGGIPIPEVDAYLYGYRNGAMCSNPDVDVLIEYAGTFGDPVLGEQIAQNMIGQGADVMIAPAGPTGLSAIYTATQSGVWGIGVDYDFYWNHFGGGSVDGSEKLLTSAVKRADNAVYQIIEDVVNTQFTSGTVIYDLAEDGVSLAPFYEADSSVPQSVKDVLDAVEEGIINGMINVALDCQVDVYIPVVVAGSE